MSGELRPNSHQNIKMTLTSARFPTHFEGEIQCAIEWDNGDDANRQEMRSVHTNTAAAESQEYLFIRLKKRSKIVSKAHINVYQSSMNTGVETIEQQPLMENIMVEALHDILEDEDIDRLLDDCQSGPAGLYGPEVNNVEAPSCKDLNAEPVAEKPYTHPYED